MTIVQLYAKLDKILVRKEHSMCTDCGQIEPVHPGDGIPASTFVMALEMMAKRHVGCRLPIGKDKA